MSPRALLPVEEALTLLAETPARIAAATRGLTEAQLHTSPVRGEWSVNEVLAHVRACADCRGEPIRMIVAEDHPTFRAVNPRTWIKQTDYQDLEFRRSFRVFAKQRAELLALLKPLPRKGWSRAATVTGAGAVLERTVLFYADWWRAINGRTSSMSSRSPDVAHLVRSRVRHTAHDDQVTHLQAAKTSLGRRSDASSFHRAPSRGECRSRCACPSPIMRRHVGQVHRDDPRRRPAHDPSHESHDLDQADELSRPGIPDLVSRLHETAC